MAWPKYVPLKSASEMTKGDYCDARGRRCLVGCAIETFNDVDELDEAKKAIREAAGLNQFGSIEAFNDSFGRTRRDLAVVWNNAMKLLGYTEVKVC